MSKENSKTKHLVAPDILPGLEWLPEIDYSREALPQIREQMKQMSAANRDAVAEPTKDTVRLSRRTIAGPAGAPDVKVLIYEPIDKDPICGAVLDIHGGGYVVGSAEMDEGFNRKIASELGLVVVSVEYRLAPDTAFPGAIEDCYAALAWMFEHAAELQIDPAKVGVLGLSAGGGLAASLAILARDRKEYALAHQCLMFPMLDDRTVTTETPNPFSGEFVWRPQDNRFGWSCLLGHEPGIDGVSPYAAAARVEDMTGLPPAFIWVGGLDLFVDENVAYATRLMRAGVPTELHVYPGVYHASAMIETAESSIALWDQAFKSMKPALGAT